MVKKRELVLTNLFSQLDTNTEQIIYLGEWCKKYNAKYKDTDFTIEYHWNDRNKLLNDYKYIKVVYENLLDQLTIILNKIHNTSNDKFFWKIYIGPWLYTFISIIYDRWFMIDKAFLELNNDFYVKIEKSKRIANFIPKDMNEFEDFFVKDTWNLYIYSLIIREYKSINKLEVSIIKENLNKNTKFEILLTLKNIIFNIYNNLAMLTHKKNSPLILASYLNLINAFKLSFKYRILPLLSYKSNKIKNTLFEKNRNFELHLDENILFERIICKLIPIQIPSIYLEEFSELNSVIKKNRWPISPKFIFTSNSLHSDDYFKFYAAQKNKLNSKIYIGQHGGYYGTGVFSLVEDHEINISDKYFSWGWEKEGFKNIIPIGKFTKTPSYNKHSKKVNILIVTLSLPRYSYSIFSITISSQLINYYNDQITFITNLNTKLKEKIIIRLHKNDYGWDQQKRFLTFFPDIQFDKNNRISKTLKYTKVFVSTYNATTFLESLSLNIPTIIYWNPKHWELNNDTIPFFDKLKSVNIFHETPESAAIFINQNWENIEDWWESNEVQRVVKEFKNKYCKPIENIVDELYYNFEKATN